MSARYFYHLTFDETNNRYLINLVIAPAALEHGDIDDEELLDSLEAGAHVTTTPPPPPLFHGVDISPHPPTPFKKYLLASSST